MAGKMSGNTSSTVQRSIGDRLDVRCGATARPTEEPTVVSTIGKSQPNLATDRLTIWQATQSQYQLISLEMFEMS